VRRGLSFLILFVAFVASTPSVHAAAERTLKARLLEIDRGHDRLRAEVRGRPAVYRVADASLLRGFRKGDLVLLRVRGATVIDLRLAVITAQVVRSDDRGALLRIGGREERFALARPGLRGKLRRGDFVRLEVEERGDGTRVVTRVF
jgi:hypothetical protein